MHELVAARSLELIGLDHVHERADGLGGILERGIVRVDLDLGEDGGHALLDTAVEKLLAQGVL